MSRLKIGITTGDPAGIGPYLIPQAIKDFNEVDFVIYGPEFVVNTFKTKGYTVACGDYKGSVKPGKYTENGGRASIAALDCAARALKKGDIDGLVTGPIDKRAFADSGLDFPGQTEFVADIMGSKRFAMNLSGPRLRITLVTTHLAIKEVAESITEESVIIAIELTHEFLSRFSNTKKIGVLGLNPHASDHGKFGNEEQEIIIPAINKAKKKFNIDIFGPLPADTAFYRAYNREFDALVAMYHDQGLGPLKLVHFKNAVNITLGLKRPRTSPDHGPAFDIAASGGLADPTSFIEAIKWAIRLA